MLKSADTHEQIKAKNPSVTTYYPHVCTLCTEFLLEFGRAQSNAQTHLPLCQWVPAISVPNHTLLSPSLVSDHAREHFGLHFPYTSLETAHLADTAVAFQLSQLQALIIIYKCRQKTRCHVNALLSIQLLHLPERSLMSSRTAVAEISL